LSAGCKLLVIKLEKSVRQKNNQKSNMCPEIWPNLYVVEKYTKTKHMYSDFPKQSKTKHMF